MRHLTLVALILTTACFPFSGAKKSLPGPYAIERSEDGTAYWLGGPGEHANGGGVLEGTIKQIGWNEKYIVAYRVSTFRGDPDGWMVVDVESQRVTGPWSETDLKKFEHIQAIRVRDTEEARKNR